MFFIWTNTFDNLNNYICNLDTRIFQLWQIHILCKGTQGRGRDAVIYKIQLKLTLTSFASPQSFTDCKIDAFWRQTITLLSILCHRILPIPIQANSSSSSQTDPGIEKCWLCRESHACRSDLRPCHVWLLAAKTLANRPRWYKQRTTYKVLYTSPIPKSCPSSPRCYKFYIHCQMKYHHGFVWLW